MHEELLVSKPPKENVKQKQNVKHRKERVRMYNCGKHNRNNQTVY